jgi:hypothetical protein
VLKVPLANRTGHNQLLKDSAWICNGLRLPLRDSRTRNQQDRSCWLPAPHHHSEYFSSHRMEINKLLTGLFVADVFQYYHLRAYQRYSTSIYCRLGITGTNYRI